MVTFYFLKFNDKLKQLLGFFLVNFPCLHSLQFFYLSKFRYRVSYNFGNTILNYDVVPFSSSKILTYSLCFNSHLQTDDIYFGFLKHYVRVL